MLQREMVYTKDECKQEAEQDWYVLIQQAKSYGYTITDIRNYLNEMKNTNENC